ncbi:branched-chain amino acid ABC transporter permease [Achromobacter sp. K91]|uniref:branched-chain amino acid ABC transporter permease n=1 Tax=Achromobacter sp. K91 TaxID=2292262 RepID=UPI000E674C7C|nr:branched-chain amino acid ABC transporter permease [Achromobacter sp. K91]RIJ05892.1 branched-chain amino acid ABC transporter permease [Achromobacter sp. K91]
MKSEIHPPGDGARHDLRILLALWGLFLLFPLVAPNSYAVGLAVTFSINLMLIASLNLLMGYCGQISMCQAGFFGLGAYVSGALSAKYGLPALASIPAALAVASTAALLIALPVLRLRGHYLAMATLGFNAILSVLFVELVDYTGGPNGLSGVEPITIAGYAFDTDRRFFYLAWAAGLLLMWGFLNLTRSRIGRAMISVAGSEVGAASLGINTYALKVAVFVLCAAVAALAGTFYVHFNQFASPETFSFSASVLLLVMVAVGGWGKYWGPLFGALVYTAVPELLRAFHDVELLLFGLGMILVLMFFPGGLAGLAQRLCRRSASLPASPVAATKGKVRHG